MVLSLNNKKQSKLLVRRILRGLQFHLTILCDLPLNVFYQAALSWTHREAIMSPQADAHLSYQHELEERDVLLTIPHLVDTDEIVQAADCLRHQHLHIRGEGKGSRASGQVLLTDQETPIHHHLVLLPECRQ